MSINDNTILITCATWALSNYYEVDPSFVGINFFRGSLLHVTQERIVGAKPTDLFQSRRKLTRALRARAREIET